MQTEKRQPMKEDKIKVATLEINNKLIWVDYLVDGKIIREIKEGK